ncbi:hypothetical protein [Cupriavidus numazuensis]|uniref:hypothetical protein n=1 Tax=Cupriavidus numazuensis TaxID=221992 RepID=UPI001BAA74A7|nr:hypothetical protein [Cupriavidus numazuensis]
MTRTIPGRPLAVILLLGLSLLACGGCERSQPGPKPISGAAASGDGQSPAPAQQPAPAR